MKFLLIILFPLISFGQRDTIYYDAGIEPTYEINILPKTRTPLVTKNDAIIYAIQFISGAVEGIHDRAYYHPDALLRSHPNLNPDWWDNRLSWDNKYHNTWFVRTFAVWVTDANHAGKALNHLCNSLSIAIAFNDFKNWKQIIKRTAIAYTVNRLGFNAFYK